MFKRFKLNENNIKWCTKRLLVKKILDTLRWHKTPILILSWVRWITKNSFQLYSVQTFLQSLLWTNLFAFVSLTNLINVISLWASLANWLLSLVKIPSVFNSTLTFKLFKLSFLLSYRRVKNSGTPNVNCRKISVRKTICDPEFSDN